MKCLYCGNPLNKGNVCPYCGQDVRLFKEIVECSWRYYDEGLTKAQARDLTGAVQSLKNSLLLYKLNTEARNLLGLVYYEMGDIAEALIEWVLSDNMDPDNHHASELMSKVQEDPAKLQAYSMAAHKYNQALKYANNGSEDLAVLQLNNVLENNPDMVKANLLMGLLQIHAGQKDKALTYIRAAQKIDRNNPQAVIMRNELRSSQSRRGTEKQKNVVSKDSEVRSGIGGDDVIVPNYKESRNGFATVLEVLAGVVLGAALTALVIMPSRISSLRSDYNQTLNSYSERLSAKEAIITSDEDEIDSLNEQIAELQSAQEAAAAENSVAAEQYSLLLQADAALEENDYRSAAELYLRIDSSLVSDEVFEEAFARLQAQFGDDGYSMLMDEGLADYNSGSYMDALDIFRSCLELDESSLEARYWLGMTYQCLGEDDSAYIYFSEIIEMDPDSDYAEQAQQQMQG